MSSPFVSASYRNLPRIPSTCQRFTISKQLLLANSSPQAWVRSASTSTPPKTIVLEKPDQFRPPSHPQRIKRRPPKQYPGPSLSEAELYAQKTKRYPHTFPNPGTRMYKFLTNKWLHLSITCGTLLVLAIVTIAQTFLYTSPFAHLIPPISTFPSHPLSYISDVVSAWKLHTDYNTDITAEKRRHQFLDAKKQRIYRRAHGIEDLDMEEDQGVDVRNMVPWDDGLTKRERAAGGRDPAYSEKMVHAVQVRMPGGEYKLFSDVVKEEFDVVDGRLIKKTESTEIPAIGEDGQIQDDPKKRKPKRWLGIW